MKKIIKKNLKIAKRNLVKIGRIDVGKLALATAKMAVRSLRFIYAQLRIRPRLRLSVMLILCLIVIFQLSSMAVAYLKPREAEIKINGQQIVVAEYVDENSAVAEVEITQVVGSNLSPFEFQKPVDGYLSQSYSRYHRANDIATALGTPIHPVGAGTVEFAGRVYDGKGNMVIIDHGDGLKSLYAHLGKINVGVGDKVESDTYIGTVGLTGRSTGPHVHLEIYDNGVQVNPVSILPSSGISGI